MVSSEIVDINNKNSPITPYSLISYRLIGRIADILMQKHYCEHIDIVDSPSATETLFEFQEKIINARKKVDCLPFADKP